MEFYEVLVDRQGHVVKRFSPQRNLHNYMKQLKLFYNTKRHPVRFSELDAFTNN